MKITDLRLGNIIQCALNEDLRIPDGIPRVVSAILPFGEVIVDLSPTNPKTVTCPIAHCSGFPLTAEWMERFGFKYEGGTGYLAPTNTEHWYTTLRNGFMPNAIARGSVEKDGYVGCHFVHQLQNLFYALTGEELTLKDK